MLIPLLAAELAASSWRNFFLRFATKYLWNPYPAKTLRDENSDSSFGDPICRRG